MNDGVVQQVAAPLDLYNDPANRFVAGFIGSPAMNFLTGRVVFTNAPAFVPAGGYPPLPLPADFRPPAALLDREVVLGVRPEHFAAAPAEQTGWQVTAQVVEMLGNETFIYFDMAGRQLIARMAGEAAVEVGQEVRLLPGQAHLRFFEPSADGARIRT